MNTWCLPIRACVLVLIAACAPSALAKPYKSAEIFTLNAEQYGKYVFRIKAAEGSGIISNFFLWKDGSELSDVFWEEVDIEIFGKNGANSWQSNIITGLGERQMSEQVHFADVGFADTYHTFTLEWTPNRVRWLVDGQLIRETLGDQAADLTSPAQARFNFWPPNIESWVGPFDNALLPVSMYVNWIEYYRWTGNGFELDWRDDFDTFSSERWGKASWTFDENRADFSPLNAEAKDGYLVLTMTTEGEEGYTGTPPPDPADQPTPEPTPNPTPEPTPNPTPEPTPEPTPTAEPLACNWYGTRYPLCVATEQGWGWEQQRSCISRSTCAMQPAPYGIVGSTTPTPTGTPVSSIRCAVTRFNHWDSGYQIDVTVTNDSGVRADTWQVQLAFNQPARITNSWNASLTPQGNQVSAAALSWNRILNPGASTTFGFQGLADSNISRPTCITSD